MNTETIKYINNLTQIIISNYEIIVPAADMYALVKKLGGSVDINKYFMNPNEFGAVQKTGKDSFVILIRDMKDTQKSNFVIARELGHLFLHMGFHTNEACWLRQTHTIHYVYSKPEQLYQANAFALALLMPEKYFLENVAKNTKEQRIDMKKVAKYFGVAFSMATNRAKDLGIIA